MSRCVMTTCGVQCDDPAEHTREGMDVCTGHALVIDNAAADRKPEPRCQWDFSPLGDVFDTWRESLDPETRLEIYGDDR